jgi:hypothetical protein
MVEQLPADEDVAGAPPEPKRINLDNVLKPPTPIKKEEVEEEPEREEPTGPEWLASNGFNWQKVPGVTAKIAEQLEQFDLDDVLEMGEDGLQDIKYVGASRAKSIYRAAMELASA